MEADRNSDYFLDKDIGRTKPTLANPWRLRAQCQCQAPHRKRMRKVPLSRSVAQRLLDSDSDALCQHRGLKNKRVERQSDLDRTWAAAWCATSVPNIAHRSRPVQQKLNALLYFKVGMRSTCVGARTACTREDTVSVRGIAYHVNRSRGVKAIPEVEQRGGRRKEALRRRRCGW
eukprot:3933691-Rhodomonas_salina.1